MTRKSHILTLVLLSCIALKGSGAFSQRAFLPGRLTRRWAGVRSTSTGSPNLWTSGRKRSARFCREHEALSLPLSAPPADSRNQSWEEIFSPQPDSETENNHDEINAFDKVVMASSLLVGILSAYALISMTAPGSWRYFAAGGICAATSHAIPTPIDVVKTRKQVNPALSDHGFIQATREIIKEEGVGALWAGLGPTACGYLLEGAVKFGTYEILKPFFKKAVSRLAAATSIAWFNSQIVAFMLCGAAAGVAASIMLCPMEAIRIRMVSEPAYATGGWLMAGCKMLKQEGVFGLCKGINPMIMKQVPYTVTKNVSFDVLTKFFYSIASAQGIVLTAGSMFTIPLLSAVLASVLSTVTSQPGDMVLSLVNAHKGNRRPREIFNSILASTHGIGGFFVGFKTRLLHVGVTVTIQLLVYDYIKRLCGIAATGTC